ncbi:alpha/beta hydrolase [Antarcticimicrobium sediminis]|uniref:Alpha/beta hydrolase n=2 Tax=Antarcticimicrobium sediminis TaxID=2546227 RepID=A0A4R5EHB2_9RHOB|nr:alpha/beta hydrolase [Antarcticimicrobium sediminis]
MVGNIPRLLTILLLAVVMTGCGNSAGRFSSTPNLYSTGRNYPAQGVSEALRTVTPQMYFVTDRAQVKQGENSAGYGLARSNSMVFGAAKVQFGDTKDWEDLVQRTHSDSGQRFSSLVVQPAREVVRFPATPLPFERLNGRIHNLAGPEQEYQQQVRLFQAAISDEIKRTGNGRILIYVHGVKNQFDDSLTVLANLWHFTGRESLPIAFSWPAGNSGIFGYFKDVEAGEFSIFHLKEFLRMLADIPEVEDIDIVAHSRGTVVVTSALRELIIEQRGKGRKPKLALKTGTLILAAADLDVGVMQQRLMAEHFAEAFEQINVYINSNDSALHLSSALTSAPRFGASSAADFSLGELESLGRIGLVNFIQVEKAGSAYGHSYFRQNPAVMSDIALTLRTRAFPGGTLRPLELDEQNLWTLHPDYPLESLPDLSQFYDR